MSKWLNLIQVEAAVDGKEFMCHLHGEGREYLANQSSGSGEEQGFNNLPTDVKNLLQTK